MKSMTCDMCDHAIEAEDFQSWFKQAQGHYMSDHADFMKAAMQKSKEAGAEKAKEEQQKWMADNMKRFEDASEV